MLMMPADQTKKELNTKKGERCMEKTMTDRERTIIPQIIEEASKLPEEDKFKLLWIAKGILIANKHGEQS